MTLVGGLANGFRIFSENLHPRNRPTMRPRNGRFQVDEEKTDVYVCGSCLKQGTDEASTGAGIWFSENDPKNKTIRLPETYKTIQEGEMAAVLVVAQTAPNFAPLNIVCRMKSTMDTLTCDLQKTVDKGYIGTRNPGLLRATVAKLQERSAKTTFEWIKNHNNQPANENSYKFAVDGAKKDRTDQLDTTIAPTFNLTGVKLASMTQALAYRGIMRTKNPTLRPSTENNISLVKTSLREMNGSTPTTERIWKSLRCRDTPRKITDFLWKATHNAYKIGKYWKNIEGLEERATCKICPQIESMEHILTECPSNERKTVWEEAKSLCEKRKIKWTTPTIGTILGLNLATARDDRGKQDNPKTRFLRIILAEAAHLIWKVRCERVINEDKYSWGRVPSTQEIKAKWNHAIQERLTTDRLSTFERAGPRKIKKEIVLETWRGVLYNERSLPKDWTSVDGVLVGNQRT